MICNSCGIDDIQCSALIYHRFYAIINQGGDNMKNFFLKGFQYFLMFQVSILIAMIISLLFIIPIRFFVYNQLYETCIFASIAFILETVSITFCFYKEKMDYKTYGLKKFLLPCIIGVVLHSILSYFNGFYMYTAGASVSESGIIWQSYYSNQIITDMREVALFRLIIPFIIILIFRISSVILGFYFGKRKIKKSIQELKKEK